MTAATSVSTSSLMAGFTATRKRPEGSFTLARVATVFATSLQGPTSAATRVLTATLSQVFSLATKALRRRGPIEV